MKLSPNNYYVLTDCQSYVNDVCILITYLIKHNCILSKQDWLIEQNIINETITEYSQKSRMKFFVGTEFHFPNIT